MAAINRAALEALVNTYILSGGKRTEAANLRAVIIALIESMLVSENDANVNLGYMKIDSSGKADVTKIKQDTPAGKVLRDDGTWDLSTFTVLTGLNITPGEIDATKSILQALGAFQAKLAAAAEITAPSLTMSTWGRYIANNAAVLDFRLPVTASVGDRLCIIGKGAGGWKITQAASQQINTSTGNTTAGVAGHLDSTNRYNCIQLECIIANTTWVVANNTGTLTVV